MRTDNGEQVKGGGGRSNACSEEELARKPAERIPPRVFAFGGTREHFDPATKVPAHYKDSISPLFLTLPDLSEKTFSPTYTLNLWLWNKCGASCD